MHKVGGGPTFDGIFRFRVVTIGFTHHRHCCAHVTGPRSHVENGTALHKVLFESIQHHGVHMWGRYLYVETNGDCG